MSQHRLATGGDWTSGSMDYPLFQRHGFRFAMRYIVPSIGGKMIQHQEIVAAHAAGIDLGFIYETDGHGWQAGAKAGVIDGSAARLALASIAAPATCAAYFTIDSQVLGSAMSLVHSYLEAASANVRPYRAGVYGQYSVIEMAAQEMPELFRWQTMAWSDGHESDHADMLQLGQTTLDGINLDVDALYQSHFGQWYAVAPYQPVYPTESEDVSGLVKSGEVVSVPVPVGTVSKLMLFADIGLMGHDPQSVRVAVHSASKGYSQIVTHALSTNVPLTIPLEERDVDGISLSRTELDGTGEIGYRVILGG